MRSHLKNRAVHVAKPIVIMRFEPQKNLAGTIAYFDAQSDEWIKSRFGTVDREHLRNNILPRMYGAVRDPAAMWREIFYAIDVEGKVVGTALAMRSESEPGTWEVSFDAVKGHGIGSQLFLHLDRWAGIMPWVTKLVAQTSSDNVEMLALFRRYAFRMQMEYGCVFVELDKHAPEDAHNPMLIALALMAEHFDSWLSICSPHIMLTLIKKYGSDIVFEEKRRATA